MADVTRTGDSSEELDRSIGLGRVLFQSIAAMGPGASIVFGLGLMILYSGQASPITMLIGVIAALCIATAISQIATRLPRAGGFYSYATRIFGGNVGFLVGWFYSVLYLLLMGLSSLNFTLVGRDFCTTYLHFTPPSWLLGVLVVGATLAATYFGVKSSTGVTVILGSLEVGILLIVSILLIIHAGSNNTLSVFNPSNAAGGGSTIRSLFLGMVFAMAALTGFEAAVPMAEETRDPRRTIPQAVVLSALFIGLFYVLAMYAAVVAWGPDRLSSYLTSPDPWRVMSHQLGGFFSFMVVLAILNSVIAGTQAGFNGTTRLLFAMSRSGMLPRALSRLHPKYHSPDVAAFIAGAAALAIMAIVSVVFDGAFGGFIFFLTVASLVFIALYIVISVGCIVYFSVERRSELNPLLHVVIPIVGILVLIGALYYSLQGLTSPANWAVPVILIWLAAGIVVLISMRISHKDVGAEELAWMRDDVAEAPLA